MRIRRQVPRVSHATLDLQHPDQWFVIHQAGQGPLWLHLAHAERVANFSGVAMPSAGRQAEEGPNVNGFAMRRLQGIKQAIDCAQRVHRTGSP